MTMTVGDSRLLVDLLYRSRLLLGQIVAVLDRFCFVSNLMHESMQIPPNTILFEVKVDVFEMILDMFQCVQIHQFYSTRYR